MMNDERRQEDMNICTEGKEDNYVYIPIDYQLSEVIFRKYYIGELSHRRYLYLAHFILPSGLRLEISRMSTGEFSVMRIETDDSRDWYLIQRNMSSLVQLLHYIRNEESISN